MEMQPLATEIINDMQGKMNCILEECEDLSIGLEKACFVLNELSEIVDTEPKNKLKALYFANDQHRIYSYTEIIYDYVSRIRSGINDLIMSIERAGQRKMINSKKLDRIITSEYSTDTVAAIIDSVPDNYSDILKEYVSEDKFLELDELINEYIASVSRAVFEQGFFRGIAAEKGGVV